MKVYIKFVVSETVKGFNRCALILFTNARMYNRVRALKGFINFIYMC